jgi:ubiquinone/menaquinone biosynthesis C-methylase UbiE
MSSANEYISYVTEIIAKSNLTGKIIADLACGFGRWGHIIRTLTDQGGHGAQIIGCDIYAPYLRTVKKHYNPYSDLVLCDVRCLPFKDKAIDITLACEILEHLKKREGYKFITEVERITTTKILLTTPNGKSLQGAKRGNVFEVHKSGWSLTEFKELGYKVIGIPVLLVAKLTVRNINNPRLFMIQALQAIKYTIKHVIPTFAEFLIATKDIKANQNNR